MKTAILIVAALGIVAGSDAFAMETLSGKVKETSATHLVIEGKGTQVMEFDVPSSVTVPRGLKEGDRVTVSFDRVLREVIKGDQQPGQAAPPTQINPEEPLPQIPILDDRVHFPA